MSCDWYLTEQDVGICINDRYCLNVMQVIGTKQLSHKIIQVFAWTNVKQMEEKLPFKRPKI